MVNIGDRPLRDFSDPLGVLGDCHRRIERFLGALLAVTEQARGEALSAVQRDALASALRYFREAAPKHTLDEEESLFPRLRAVRDPRVQRALEAIQFLEADHRATVVDHAEIDVLGSRWLRAGCLPPALARELAARLHEIEALYRNHIAIEDREIFPLARAVLPEQAVAEIGKEMARRRGVEPGRSQDAPAAIGA